MKKVIRIFSFFIVTALFLSACSSVKKEWQYAASQNHPIAYQAFLAKHPDSKYSDEAKSRIEMLEWQRAEKYNLQSSYEAFLKKHPYSNHASEAKARIEAFEWKRAEESGAPSLFRKFIRKYPSSQHVNEAYAGIALYIRNEWDKTKKIDQIPAYQRFIQLYPDSEYVSQAKERMNWQKAHPARVKIIYPKTVTAGYRYRWNTVFRETGGKAGFTLMSTNFHIRDPKGRKWTNSWREDVRVRPNGRAKIDYWCDKSSKWAGGYYYVTWEGVDDWGNQISIVQKVHLAK